MGLSKQKPLVKYTKKGTLLGSLFGTFLDALLNICIYAKYDKLYHFVLKHYCFNKDIQNYKYFFNGFVYKIMKNRVQKETGYFSVYFTSSPV